jgi:hypothetical protein
MNLDDIYIEEAYTTNIPSTPSLNIQPQPQQVKSENESAKSVKDWIRLPFIDTPFKARMAAILIVELIINLTKDQALRDLVLKEIRVNNRLQKR